MDREVFKQTRPVGEEARKLYNKMYYQANKEKIIKKSVERQKEYYKQNPNYYNAYSKRYYENNKEYFRNWHKENAEYMKMCKRERYRNNNGREKSKNYQRVKRSVNCLPLDNKLIKYDTSLSIEI